MTISIEEKLALAIVLIIALLGGGALFCIHLIDAGKAEEKAAVFQAEQKAEQKAAQIEKTWQAQLAAAQSARQGEINAALEESLKPVATVSLQRYTYSPAVPASPAAPGASASPAASGSVCSGLVPGSSAEMRSFNDAKSADQLIADYRDLYNSWPTIGTTH